MKIQIKNMAIVLTPKPIKGTRNGLQVSFAPTKKWLKENTQIHPLMRCNINSGQDRYELPPFFDVKSINRITARYDGEVSVHTQIP